MSETPKHQEKAEEHAAAHEATAPAHEEPHKPGPGKQIGISMALLGVMLALCAALVGSHRTDLIKTTIEQSNKWGLYQAEAMKVRVIEGDVELLNALSPNMEEEKALDKTLREKRASGGKVDDEDTAEIKDLVATSVGDLAELLTPDPEDKAALLKLGKKYEVDMKEAKEDAEAYDKRIEAHYEAAEWYERSQLLAEIGIVVASVALLMASKRIWYIAVTAGVLGAGIIGVTFVRTHSALAEADKKLQAAKEHEEKIDEDDDEKPSPSASVSASGAAKPEK